MLEKNNMATYGWLFDAKRCIECSACEAACKQWNGVPTGVNVRWRRVIRQESGPFPQVNIEAVSMACNHCENPLCVRACPAKALRQRHDGIVLLDADKCLGCGQCRQFCPYGAPQLNLTARKASKCTMCADRIDEGLQPACSTICPTGALQWGEWEEIKSKGSSPAGKWAHPPQMRPRIRFVLEPWR